jgi:hypothetical protein
MRVILNDRVRAALHWESAAAVKEAEGQIIGSTIRNGRTMPFPRYSVILPTPDFKGDIEQSSLAARRASATSTRSCRPARPSGA